MRTLILMRHAKAVKGSEAPSDEARGLSPRGRRDASAAGAALSEQGLKPALALISTSVRTRETADVALAGMAVATQFEKALYHAAPEGVWDAFTASEAEKRSVSLSVYNAVHERGEACVYEYRGALAARWYDVSTCP